MSLYNKSPGSYMNILLHSKPLGLVFLPRGGEICVSQPFTRLEAGQVDSNIEPVVFAFMHFGSRGISSRAFSLGHIAHVPLCMLQLDVVPNLDSQLPVARNFGLRFPSITLVRLRRGDVHFPDVFDQATIGDGRRAVQNRIDGFVVTLEPHQLVELPERLVIDLATIFLLFVVQDVRNA